MGKIKIIILILSLKTPAKNQRFLKQRKAFQNVDRAIKKEKYRYIIKEKK